MAELTLVSAPDFELPADADANNEYEVVVEASDGQGGAATQTIRVIVTPVNDHTPQFTSPDSASVAENSTSVLTVTATDADLPAEAIVLSIVGGADQRSSLSRRRSRLVTVTLFRIADRRQRRQRS